MLYIYRICCDMAVTGTESDSMMGGEGRGGREGEVGERAIGAEARGAMWPRREEGKEGRKDRKEGDGRAKQIFH